MHRIVSWLWVLLPACLCGVQGSPANYSVFTELQAELGDQLALIFHKKPYIPCGPPNANRVWAEPFANWLREGNVGGQTGFVAKTEGIAGGLDREFGGEWVLGLGGSYEDTQLALRLGEGSGSSRGYYGAFYTDYGSDHFHFGISLLAGQNRSKLSQSLLHNTTSVSGAFQSLDLIGQLATAYLFGTPAGFIYPYAIADFLYRKSDSFQETGNSALNSVIGSHLTTTLRCEAGFMVQVQNTNYDETMCISPSFGLGWIMELPLHRPAYQSHFVGDSTPFESVGWDHTWQLFSFAFGLSLSYKCLTIAGQYQGEIDPDGRETFFGQRCNLKLELNW